MRLSKILVIAAHPDDEIIGCGGTVARLVDEGNSAFTVIVGEDRGLKKQAMEAGEIIGVHEIRFLGYKDNKFDEVSLLDIVQSIESMLEIYQPDIIFTHFRNDLNIDHELTYRAVITATRPMPYQTVKKIYSFEILSSTEWRYPTSFSPNVFWAIEGTLNRKIKAISKYETELKDYPHPRSKIGITLNADYWGMKAGLISAEPFEMVRAIY